MKNSNQDQHMKTRRQKTRGMYSRLILMTAVMFFAMFFIMYSMVDSTNELIFNINNLYMTLLMTSTMIIIEVIIMKSMYSDRKVNLIVLLSVSVIMIFSWLGIREQIGVGDKEFLRGMIPHHSAALLMSKNAKLTDPELIQLRDSILATQQREIKFMRSKMEMLQK